MIRMPAVCSDGDIAMARGRTERVLSMERGRAVGAAEFARESRSLLFVSAAATSFLPVQPARPIARLRRVLHLNPGTVQPGHGVPSSAVSRAQSARTAGRARTIDDERLAG